MCLGLLRDVLPQMGRQGCLKSLGRFGGVNPWEGLVARFRKVTSNISHNGKRWDSPVAQHFVTNAVTLFETLRPSSSVWQRHDYSIIAVVQLLHKGLFMQ